MVGRHGDVVWMRMVVAYELVSLDGVAESPDSFLFDFDEVMDDHLRWVIAEQDTVLLGRRMYDEWAAFWPTSDMQPFADFINAVPKHVVTSTPLTDPWTNATALDGATLGASVEELKRADGGDIGVHGSIDLARSLLRVGLVDELRLVVAPTVAGRGRRLFEGVELTRLDLLRSTTTPSGALLVDYAVRR
jgi:dihydrofolate reductase